MDCPLLMVEAEVRYWEDAKFNGIEDTEGTLVPFREGKVWKPVIDLRTGTFVNWPDGMTARIHYKVCDAGQYWLADVDGVKRLKWRGDYVPDRFLCMGDWGYGDYIILNVNIRGEIADWCEPVIDSSWEFVNPKEAT